MVVKPLSSQGLLSFNIRNVETLFPGFTMGDFVVMYGQPYVSTLSLLLAVRAQLPYQLGGLESSVVFVDGGNTFRLYKVSRLARLHHLKPREVLERIFISRAFTMHQMTSLLLDGLEEAAKRHGAKLVIVSDFEGLFLDEDIKPEESREIFSQVVAYVSEFAKNNDAIVIAACPPHYYCRYGAFLHAVACSKSTITISIIKKRSYPFERQFMLEKHPSFKLGAVNFPSKNLTLHDFMGGQ